MDEMKPRTDRLYRSRKERMVAGVCGGLAQYFNVDPVLVRVAFVALVIVWGAGILAYIAMAIIFPERPIEEGEPDLASTTRRGGGEVLAYILVFIGALALVNNLGVFRSISNDLFWPFVLIGIGALLLLRRAQD